MFNQIIHRRSGSGLCVFSGNLILLSLCSVALVLVAFAVEEVGGNQIKLDDFGSPSRIRPAGKSLRPITTKAPHDVIAVAPAPAKSAAALSYYDHQGGGPVLPTTLAEVSIAHDDPFRNAVKLTKDKRYKIVSSENDDSSSVSSASSEKEGGGGEAVLRLYAAAGVNDDDDDGNGGVDMGLESIGPKREGAGRRRGGSHHHDHEDVQDLLERFINSRPDLSNNLDVITQAFRFVKLDAHLGALVNQLIKLQQSHDTLQSVTVKQETKFDILMEEMRLLGSSLQSESTKLKAVEERLELELSTMNQRLDSAVEKIIKSSTSSQILVEMSKESLQQIHQLESVNNKVLGELKAVQTELGDVGQASVQTVFNVQKAEENLMKAMEETANRTIYAMRQEASSTTAAAALLQHGGGGGGGGSVVLGNGSGGNSAVQADANTISGSSSSSSGGPPLTSSSAATSSSSSKPTFKSSMSCSSRKRLINGRPRDCSEIQLSGHSRNGVYQVYPFTSTSSSANQGVELYCDLESSDGGGWTVIQRRSHHEIPRENFFRAWKDYETGFGSPYNHVWLGLLALADLTADGDQELRVELEDWDNNSRFAQYGYFRVANSTDLYRLHVADYSGDAGDSLAYHNGMPFSTKDRDNDLDRTINCAQKYHGAWWYKNCHQANLNGLYSRKQDSVYGTGLNWTPWRGYYYSLRSTVMKIRNRHFK